VLTVVGGLVAVVGVAIVNTRGRTGAVPV